MERTLLNLGSARALFVRPLFQGVFDVARCDVDDRLGELVGLSGRLGAWVGGSNPFAPTKIQGIFKDLYRV